jgi:hypothetical protein
MAQDFYDILQVSQYLYNRINDNKVALGLRYVAYGDEQLLPEYPAAVVTTERPLRREFHGTRQFLVTFECDIFVLHANLAASHRIRTIEDIQLAEAIRKFLHSDFTLGGHIIFGYVDLEIPGIVTRVVGQKSAMIVTTRLSWTGQNRVNFDDA